MPSVCYALSILFDYDGNEQLKQVTVDQIACKSRDQAVEELGHHQYEKELDDSFRHCFCTSAYS